MVHDISSGSSSASRRRLLIILAFNYYISVAQDLPFWKRFGEMVVISLGVAALSFLIGLAAKQLLGINVG